MHVRDETARATERDTLAFRELLRPTSTLPRSQYERETLMSAYLAEAAKLAHELEPSDPMTAYGVYYRDAAFWINRSAA